MQPPRVDKDSKWKQNTSFLRYSSVAIQMMLGIALPTWAGLQLDRYFNFSFPWGVLTGSLFGLGVSLYSVLKNLS